MIRKITKWIGTPTSMVAHSFFFLGIFSLRFFSVSVQDILLTLTTIVSLEAIYLSIFIQMTVNENTRSLEEVKEQVEDVKESVDEVQESVDEVQESVDEE